MFLEGLVLATCISGSECTNVIQAYYEYNKDLKAIVEYNSRKLEKMIDKDNQAYVITLGMLIGIASNREGTIVLDKHYNFEFKKDNSDTINSITFVYKGSF